MLTRLTYLLLWPLACYFTVAALTHPAIAPLWSAPLWLAMPAAP